MTAAPNPAPGFKRNPDKRITLEPHGVPVRVVADGVVIAVSAKAKLMRESGAPEVLYLPFADINFANLERTDSRTHCPYKGDASYWRLAGPGKPGHDVMWAYEHPFDEMLAIRDHGAFYTDRVTLEPA